MANGAELYKSPANHRKKNYQKSSQLPQHGDGDHYRRKHHSLQAAYNEIIAEKNEVIRSQELSIKRLKAKYQNILQENEELQKIPTQRKEKGPPTIKEWKVLQDNAAVVLEQNDILSGKIKTLQQKMEVLKVAHAETLSKLTRKMKDLEAKLSSYKISYGHLESHCAVLTDQNSKMTDMIDKRIPREDHESSVYECKKLFENLKLSYNDERVVLQDKNAALEKERERLVGEATKLETEKINILEELKMLEEALSYKEGKIKDLQSKLFETTQSQRATTATVSEMMELAQTVISERESLEKSLEEQRSLNEHMMFVRSKETELVAELQGKNKLMKDLHQQEIEKLLRRIKDLEKVLDTIGDRHREEVSNLKDIIKEKSIRIDLIEANNKQLQNDLGSVWLAAKDRVVVLQD